MNGNISTYGFTWGPATITRLCTDQKKGWVLIGLTTAKHPNGFQLYVTQTGNVRIYGPDNREWQPKPKCKP